MYILSLVEMRGDEQLAWLLTSVPPNCILLLEDVDAVGIKRQSKRPDANNEELDGATHDTESSVNDGKKSKQATAHDRDRVKAKYRYDGSDDGDQSIRPKRKHTHRKSAPKITLSCLLKVAGPEGHILVMTTNRPEDLDDALIRAGRINVRFAFEKASKDTAEGIFLNLYLPIKVDRVETGQVKDELDEAPSQMHNKSESDVRHMAIEFADQVQDGEFSPADLQDYFLARESDPCRAVDELGKLQAQLKHEQERKRTKQDKRFTRSQMCGDMGNTYTNRTSSTIAAWYNDLNTRTADAMLNELPNLPAPRYGIRDNAWRNNEAVDMY